MVDQSAVGHTFAPINAHVEPGRLRFFFDTIGEKNPVYRDEEAAREAGYGAIPVPPTYLFCLEMMDADDPFNFLKELKIDLARILHGTQSFAYHKPVIVGDALTFASSVTGVIDKKGGALTIVDITTRITNQRDDHVADMNRGIVVRN